MQTCFLTILTFPSSWNILVLKEVFLKLSLSEKEKLQITKSSLLQDALDIKLATKAPVRTSCSLWWLCYMSKRTYGHESLLLGLRLMRPIADDDFVICRNARMDIRLCHQVDVSCVLQLMMTLLYVDTHVRACACIAKPTSNASRAGDDEFVIWRLQTCQHFI